MDSLDVNNGKPIYFVSNMNDEFKMLIEPLKKLLKENEYLLYSGNEGEKIINVDDWTGKIAIFCTPSIIYGIQITNSMYLDATIKLHILIV